MEWIGRRVLRGNADRGLAALAGMAGILITAAAFAQPVPDYDFDWVTIRDVNNPEIDAGAYEGPVDGRGSVGHPYRISRYEVSTGQWLEFVNTFSTQSWGLRYFAQPSIWMADIDPNYDGPGYRYVLINEPQAAQSPVFGITWHDAARYCNWLQNGKDSSLESLEDGVYDTSTFGWNPDNTITDQRTHHPDADYWIPTWDEWLKAAHYNPVSRQWQKWGNRENIPFVGGCPGDGMTSTTAWECGPSYTFAPFDIPLGAYDTTSPYGLYDVSGGGEEWTEELNAGRYRFAEGLGAGAGVYSDNQYNPDTLFVASGYPPNGAGFTTVRVASLVPCNADLNEDGELDFGDIHAFLDALASGDHLADWNGDGVSDFFDVVGYLSEFADGCP